MVESILFSLITLTAMVTGIYIGYKLRGDGGKDKLPDIKSPKKIIEERKEKAALDAEIEDTKKWIEEINNYNGEFGE